MQNTEISRFIDQHLGKRADFVKEIIADRVYLVEAGGKKFIFKITNLIWAVDEVFFLQEIHKHQIPAPELIAYGKYLDKQGYLILEYIPNCVDRLTDEIRRDIHFWEQLAEGLKRIHTIPVAGFGFNRSAAFGRQEFTALTFRKFVNVIFEELHRDLASSPYHSLVDSLQNHGDGLKNHTQAYLAHGDIGGNNFLWDVKKKQLYFLDASYLRGMPRTWDLAYFGWRTGHDRVIPEDVQKLTALYFGDELTEYDEFEMTFLRVLTGLMKIRDGISDNNMKESYVSATQHHLDALDLLKGEESLSR